MKKEIRIENISKIIKDLNERQGKLQEWYFSVSILQHEIELMFGYKEERDLIRNTLRYLINEGKIIKSTDRGFYYGFIKHKYVSVIEQLDKAKELETTKEFKRILIELDNLDEKDINRYYRLESIFSTIVENGTITLKTYKDRVKDIKDPEVIEVRNIEELYKWVSENKVNRLMSIDFIKLIHSEITKGLEGTNRFTSKSGELTKRTNFIGGGYLPCLLENKISELEQWIPFYNTKPESINEALTRLAIIHHWFAGIHPFGDANSRAGRFLCSYYLYMHGYTKTLNFGISRALKDIGGKRQFMLSQAEAWDNNDINKYIEWFINELINEQWVISTRSFLE